MLDRRAPHLGVLLRRYQRVSKYVVAGGTAAAVDLGLLYFLTDVIGFHYLVSATLAFIVAFFVSFTLQKFWTFGDEDMDRIHSQLVAYLVIAIVNILVNVGLMYLFVSVIGIWYFFAQILAGATIACYGFLLYRHVIFRKPQFVADETGTGTRR